MISRDEFRYYKNELMSQKHLFPLVSVALSDIERVERVLVEIP